MCLHTHVYICIYVSMYLIRIDLDVELLVGVILRSCDRVHKHDRTG